MTLKTILFISSSIALSVACGNGHDGKGRGSAAQGAVEAAKTQPVAPAAAETPKPEGQIAPSAAAEPTRVETGKPVEGPGGEMIPGFLANQAQLGKKDSDTTPTDRGGLYKMAKKAREEGLVDEALAYIDVLLLMEPNDPEFLEFRGVMQLKQGMVEDAKVDLSRCCQLGRTTCCRWMERP